MPTFSRILLGTACRMVVASCVITSTLLSQEHSGEARVSPPVIKETVQEVSLNLTVHDGHRRPVGDLKAEEFRILDDGKPVEIRNFRFITSSKSSASPRLVSILIESLGQGTGELVHDVLLSILRFANQSNVYFSLWQINGGLKVVSGFTQDREALQQNIQQFAGTGKHREYLSKKRASSANGQISSTKILETEPPLPVIGQKAVQAAEQIARDSHASPGVCGLLALIQQQAAFPGRKEIFYFSEGLRATESIEQELRLLISRANRSGVSIYTVDTSGVELRARAEAANLIVIGATDRISSGVQTDTQRVTGGSTPQPTGDLTRLTARGPARSPEFDSVNNKTISDRESTLRALAAQTGGSYIDLSDFREPVRLAADDLENYYEITYKPSVEPLDGHLRPISVSVSRPHLLVQNHAAYFSTASIGAFDLAPFEIPLAHAIRTSQPYNALLFNSRVFHFGQQTAALTIQLPFSEFQAQEDPKEKLLKLHFSFLVLVRSSDGRVIEKASEDVPYEIATERRQQIQGEVFSFERYFLLNPGDYQADIAVADQEANTIGVKSISFGIPPAQPGLGLSDAVLMKRLDAGTQGEDQDPLRYGNERVTPELSPVIEMSPGGTVPVFLTIYPDSKAGARVALEFQISVNGKSLGQVPVAINEAASKQPTSFVVSLKEDSLPPGRYLLIAKASQGAQSREQRIDFTLTGSSTGGASKVPLVASPASAAADENQNPSLITLIPVPKIAPGGKRPTAAEIELILDAARSRALDYKSGLPNFVCIEVTRRYSDPSGRQAWKENDTLTELLRYQSGFEEYETLELNGQARRVARADLGGIRTSGEFGDLLDAIFSTKAAAEFDWQGESSLEDSRVYVFKYAVAQKHSMYVLATEDNRRRFVAAFHGFVYIDRDTYMVRQVSLQADGLPPDFPYRDSAISVTYDYVAIGGTRYVLPVTATLVICRKKHWLSKNEMRFTEYRRFTASSNVRYR